MPRVARIYSEFKIYHVTIRGIDKQNIFFDEKDRYIHQNPLKAQIEKTENYKWSSYKEYIEKNKIINSTFLLLFFSKNIKKAKEEFVKFHNINSNEDKETEIKNIFEYELCEKFTDEEIAKYICELFNIDNVYEILQYNNKIRNEKIAKLKCFKSVPISQLSRVIGVNRKMLERTIKKEHMSQMDKNVQKETSHLDTEVNDGKK